MLIKVHESYRTVVAICDSNLIGKKFEDERRQLEIKDRFFRGEEKNQEEAIRIIKNQILEDATFNIVGKESIDAAIKAGLISEESVGEVQGIPFALVLL